MTKLMSLTDRMNAVKNSKPEIMYSVAGANFQEWALSNLDNRGSIAHKSIGKFVTAINNNQITIESAKSPLNQPNLSLSPFSSNQD